MKELLDYAKRFEGVEEIVGEKHNPMIVNWSHELGHEWVDNDEMPWCAVFINMILKRRGYQYTGKLNARSFLDIGLPIETPLEGCIVVFKRGKNPLHGHVGLWEGEKGKKTLCYSGNQGNKVCSAEYSTADVIGYRLLYKLPFKTIVDHNNEELNFDESNGLDTLIGLISDILGSDWTIKQKVIKT